MNKKQTLSILIAIAILISIPILTPKPQKTTENPEIKNNTLYMICDYKEEICEQSNSQVAIHTGQNNITFKPLTLNNPLSKKIMNQTTSNYPLYLYNTNQTPRGKNCWMYGAVPHISMIQQFTQQCRENGTYNAQRTMETET